MNNFTGDFNRDIKAAPSNTYLPIKNRKKLTFFFLIMSFFVLSFTPKISVASWFNPFDANIFCGSKCSSFVSMPGKVGIGMLTGIPVGISLGVPISIGVSIVSAASLHKPKKILQETAIALGTSTLIGVGLGAFVVSNMIALPFWVVEATVYREPKKFVDYITQSSNEHCGRQ